MLAFNLLIIDLIFDGVHKVDGVQKNCYFE